MKNTQIQSSKKCKVVVLKGKSGNVHPIKPLFVKKKRLTIDYEKMSQGGNFKHVAHISH